MYVLVDTAIVGHLGTTPLGGLALASTALNSLVWICNFLAYGTTARVAWLTGRRDDAGAGAVAVQGLWLCGVLGLPLALLLAVGAQPAGRALGGHARVLAAGVTYLRISAVGVPAVPVALVGNGYLRGPSDTRTPPVILAVANVANLVLELLFVYGFGWGLRGSAWGTVIAQWLAAAWFGALLLRRFRAAGGPMAPVPSEMRPMIVIGRDLFFRTGAILAAFAAATACAARLGPERLAAHQVAYQLFLFLALSVDALAIAGQALVGTALGAGDDDEAALVARRLIRRGFQVAVVLLIALVAGAGALPHLFTADDGVARRAEPAIVLLGVLQLPGATAFVLDGVLIGASDFTYLAAVSVAALVLFVPFAVAVLVDHDLGLPMLWLGLLVWMTGRAAANWARVVSGRWTTPVAR